MVTIGEAASGTDLPNVETGIPRFPRTRGDRPAPGNEDVREYLVPPYTRG